MRPAWYVGGLGRPRSGQASKDGGQFRVSPCRERLTQADVELVLVQAALHECDLELLGRLFAVSARRPHAATAYQVCRQLIARIRHRRYLPAHAMQAQA